MAFRRRRIDPIEVGEKLGVQYLVSGRVFRSGPRVRLWVELLDVASASVLWAEKYEFGIDELFQLQDEIAIKIVGQIATHVRQTEIERALRKPPQNLNAYDYLLRGLDLLYTLDFADFSRARTLLEKAREEDPGTQLPLLSPPIGTCSTLPKAGRRTSTPTRRRSSGYRIVRSNGIDPMASPLRCRDTQERCSFETMMPRSIASTVQRQSRRAIPGHGPSAAAPTASLAGRKRRSREQSGPFDCRRPTLTLSSNWSYLVRTTTWTARMRMRSAGHRSL